MIKEEKRHKKMPLWMTVLVYALVSATFALLFGGSLWDSLAGALVAGVLAFVGSIRSDYINPLAKTLLLSFLAGTLSYAKPNVPRSAATQITMGWIPALIRFSGTVLPSQKMAMEYPVAMRIAEIQDCTVFRIPARRSPHKRSRMALPKAIPGIRSIMVAIMIISALSPIPMRTLA